MAITAEIGKPDLAPEGIDMGGDELRILIISHSHPEISKGGAEIAAYELYRGITSQSGCAAWFLGCDRREKKSDIPISQPFGPHEYLYSAGEFDWFKFANLDARFPAEFSRLLAELSPDIVHFHHYINVGVEAFLHVRRVLPNARIFVTLHEYLAICNHHGQMVTKPNRDLCYHGGAVRCGECFPELDESDFFMRRRYVSHFFRMVDHFISPSQFLADRYVAWGVEPEHISVVENVIRPAKDVQGIRPIRTAGHLRIGFFGQLSFLKGTKVLLDAAAQFDNEDRSDVSFEIFGDYRSQPPDFQMELLERMSKAGQNVKFHGPYDQSRVDQLMQSVDAVIVPSTWWENSPLVIQEAFRNGRPVICSDVGGMAEKVRDGVDGFHFRAGSATDLVSLLKRLADDRSALADIAQTICRPSAAAAIIEAHILLYRQLAASPRSSRHVAGETIGG